MAVGWRVGEEAARVYGGADRCRVSGGGGHGCVLAREPASSSARLEEVRSTLFNAAVQLDADRWAQIGVQDAVLALGWRCSRQLLFPRRVDAVSVGSRSRQVEDTPGVACYVLIRDVKGRVVLSCPLFTVLSACVASSSRRVIRTSADRW